MITKRAVDWRAVGDTLLTPEVLGAIIGGAGAPLATYLVRRKREMPALRRLAELLAAGVLGAGAGAGIGYGGKKGMEALLELFSEGVPIVRKEEPVPPPYNEDELVYKPYRDEEALAVTEAITRMRLMRDRDIREALAGVAKRFNLSPEQAKQYGIDVLMGPVPTREQIQEALKEGPLGGWPIAVGLESVLPPNLVPSSYRTGP